VRDGATVGTDINFQATTSSISANWVPGTDLVGIKRYEYCFTTSATGSDCAGGATISWTSNLTSQQVTRNGLALTPATTYYACVQDVDNLDNYSLTSTCSDGVTIDTTGPTGVAAITPLDGALNVGEGMLTFDWSAGRRRRLGRCKVRRDHRWRAQGERAGRHVEWHVCDLPGKPHVVDQGLRCCRQLHHLPLHIHRDSSARCDTAERIPTC